MSSSATASPEFTEALANVRRQSASKLSHNSKPAQLLTAIESTLSASLKTDVLPHTPTAYFVSVLQCLEKACSDDLEGGEDEDAMAETENMGQGALIPALLYLLAIVVPETPGNVVVSKLSAILGSTLPLFDTAMDHPPALRSLIQIVTALIGFASPQVLNASPLLKKSWNYLLELNLDPRPKVRHMAQEGVRKVLTTPVPPKLTAGNHPYLPKAREWVVGILEEEGKNGGSSGGAGGKKKARFADGEDSEGKRAIWVVQGLRGWAAVWGESQMPQLCSLLLSLPPLPHLTPQIYSLLATLFTPPPADSTTAAPAVLTNLPTVIDSLIASPPNINSNTVDIPSYLSALTSALVKLSIQDPLSLPAYIPKAFNLIYHNMLLAQSPSPAVMVAASDAIGSQGLLRYCVSDDMIVASVNYKLQGSDQPGARKKQKTPFLSKLIAALSESLDSHALRIQYLLPILTAAISRLRLRVTDGQHAEIDVNGKGITAAEILLMDLIKEIADLKNDAGFEHKAKVDEVVGMAIEVIGVEGVLKGLPLNIEPDATGKTPQPGRAYLLPLIRTRTTNDSLLFFATYFRPLSERLFGKKVAATDGDRLGEAKIWDIMVGQVWDCFPGFCEMPRDMKEALDTPFLSLLTNLLYNQQSLLPALLRALAQLVKSTDRLLHSSTDSAELRKQFGMDQTDAKNNIDHLKTKAKDMVAVLLNVFSQLPREQRGMVGEVIGAWTGIMTDADVNETYVNVTSHLSKALETTAPIAAGASPLSHTMLDLLIIFVPYLPPAQSTSLFNATATPAMLTHPDATVQKKSYRLLKRLLEGGKMTLQAKQLEQFVEKLNTVGGGVGPGAQRDRLQLLSSLVDNLPGDLLALIPELLSEAVLGTKEVNEKARDAGFDLLVVMGHKMAQGGSVTRTVIDEDGEAEQEESVQANAEEYITMVAAGLTGATPHMISASINALSRLLFEFKDSISTATISELVATITVFLQSKNREIVKSALGFVKVAIVALPHEAVSPHLQALVPALLGWVHDHKNHFKQKTVHIFERLIRKFGYDDVYRFAGEGDEKKVLVGIRRKKERAKKKKAAAGADGAGGDEDEDAVKKTSTGNAFDDILYNSDSDLGSDDDADDDAPPRPQASKGGRFQSQQQQFQQQQQQQKGGKKDKKREANASYIRNEGDEPMDLLSRSIAGNVASSDPSAASRRRKPGQDASHFKTDRSGKLIIDEPRAEDGPTETERMAGDAFLANQTSTDGAHRDARGTLKFNKNTKRTRETEREYEETFGAGIIDQDKEVPKKKKQQVGKLGEEFRSKRGKGDVKKQGGPDPYSYVPIDQAARNKKGQQNRMSFTNKKKGSKA